MLDLQFLFNNYGSNGSLTIICYILYQPKTISFFYIYCMHEIKINIIKQLSNLFEKHLLINDKQQH